MFKLLVTLVTFLLLALAVMGMRQHARELNSETAKVVNQLELGKHRMWGQTPGITAVSNPPALAKSLQEHGLAGPVGQVDAGRSRVLPDDSGDLVAPLRRRP